MGREQLPVENNFSNVELIDAPQDKCGIVGVYAPNGGAVMLAHDAINALQHRGQDGVGVSYIEHGASDYSYIEIQKRLGRVAAGFNNGQDLEHLTWPEYASAHVRYGTTEADDSFSAINPIRVYVPSSEKSFTVAHNGQFDMDILEDLVQEANIFYGSELNMLGTDSETFAELLGVYVDHYGHLESAMHKLLPKLEGAFSLSILSDDGIYAARDRHGVRPLVVGNIPEQEATIFASEVGALNVVEAKFDKEVDPGTYVVISRDGVREERWSNEDKALCIFEYEYLSKPDNIIDGVMVGDTRFRAGEKLAQTLPENADMIVPILGSAKMYAKGLESASGVTYEEALKKNPDRENPESERTFIEKTQAEREAAVRNKFIIDSDLVDGKSVVLIDDSLVRGTTTRTIVAMLKEAGASKVHVRIGSAKYVKPCRFGVNVQTEEELLSYCRTTDEMREAIGADSLLFLSHDEMLSAVGKQKSEVCSGCMGGSYPEARQQVKVPALAL